MELQPSIMGMWILTILTILRTGYITFWTKARGLMMHGVHLPHGPGVPAVVSTIWLLTERLQKIRLPSSDIQEVGKPRSGQELRISDLQWLLQTNRGPVEQQSRDGVLVKQLPELIPPSRIGFVPITGNTTTTNRPCL